MFTKEEQERVPEALAKVFKKVESRLFVDIIKRLSEAKEITRTIDYQLYMFNQFQSFKKDYKKMIQDALILSNDIIESMFEKVVAEGYSHDKSLYEESGKEFIPFEENQAIIQLSNAVKEATKGDLENITKTLAFSTSEGKKDVMRYFRERLNQAVLEISTGSYSHTQSINKVVSELCESGLKTVDYDSGRTDRVDVAVRRATLTGLAKITGKIAEQNAKKLGTEYFEVSAHPTARPSHMLWQGGIYTKDQLKTVCGLGEVQGLCGINCYHHYDAFLIGISKPRYTHDELMKMRNEALRVKEYLGKRYTLYEAVQKQRQFERRMRILDEKIDLLKIAGAEKELIKEVQNKRFTVYQIYKNFSKNFNLQEHMDRVFTSDKKYIRMPSESI